MRKSKSVFIISIFIIFFFHNIIFALETDTHRTINLKIAKSSMNGFSLNQYLKSNLGFSQGIDETFDGRRVDVWLELGGLYEDKPPWTIPYTRSMNHFHNPLKTWDAAGFKGTFQSSVIWAQDQGTFGSLWGGDWSWKKARNSFYKGLTGATKTDRDTNLSDTFRSLGQVMHLVQDVSVPAHTRNDAHVLGYELGVDELRKMDDPIFLNAIANPITFESSVLTLTPNPLAPIPIAKIFDTDNYYNTDPNPNVTIGNTIGLSEYTNANFISEGLISANFQNFPHPQIYSDTPIIEKSYTGSSGTFNRQYYLKNCCGETNSGQGYLLSVVDYLDYWRQKYPLLSIGLPKIPGLDYNVYKDYASLLIPRAVGYSAGLLDYFFRGNIEISLPLSGVYAQTDDPNQSFTKITLLARNTTSNDEEINDGSIELVVRYKIAFEDPFHSYPVPTTEEFIYKVFSEVNAARSIPKDAPIELTFDLSQDSMPLYATDVYLQLVYRGKLGNEDGAVVVGFKDISEPTPVDIFNNMDMICLNGSWYVAGSPEAIAQVDTNGNGIPEWDIYPHDLIDAYLRMSPISNPQAASPTEYTFYTPSIPAGGFYRAFILSDSQIGLSDYIRTVETDPNDTSWIHILKESIWSGATIVNQVEYQVEQQEECEKVGATVPCDIRYYPLFYPFRGRDMWGPAGAIYDNPEYPTGTKCSWELLR